ncbi:LicD family protein [Clostridium sp. M62/1]|uniref:LicD family protein n=1 Tax=Clostridium sp. M62/1 TaxID=411486 RepID=UPI000197374F|nr:LicD family protein [Clostridium sp. M62/1]EFE14041.1 LICD family protein [Clostridium sp. M62/1]UEB80297.1 LicD family protein [Clostridium sp. M62/1]
MQEMTNQEMQAVELDVLRVLARICEEQHLDYFLIYGTLLGAARHKGFIPWDDDLDIMMKRADYDKLLKYLMDHESELLPYKLFCKYNNPEYPFMIARFCDTRYKYVANNEKDCGMGIFVDIYPLDGAGRTWKEVQRKGNYYRFLSSMCFLASREHFFVAHEEYSSKKSIKQTIVKYPLYLIAKTTGVRFWFKRLEALKEKHKYSECDYVGPTTWQSDYKRDVMKKEWVDETVLIEFEGEQFRAPKEYKKILKHKYGNYMEMPPVEKRVATHDYKAYRK